MKRQSIGVLSILIAIHGSPVAAADLAFDVHLGIPLGGGVPYLGFGVGTSSDPARDLDATPPPRIELRYEADGTQTFLVNGFAVERPLVLSASDDAGPGEDFDWQTLLGAVLGIGLIAALVSADDSTIIVCSGTDCPPEKPPAEPQPTDTAAEN